MKKIIFTAAIASLLAANSYAREDIRIVGSSTVYPFITVAAENFANSGKFNAPVVERNGTGAGFEMFCSGVGAKTPDFVNASRQIKDSERESCKKNGVDKVAEIKIGYDGIVLGVSQKSDDFNITKEQFFLALSRNVPKDGKLVRNFYKKWSDIDKSLPDRKISVYGPPPTSGTKDALVEIVMEKSCEKFPEYAKANPDKNNLKMACSQIREDGVYIQGTENDNITISKIVINDNAVGVFGYSYYEENMDKVKAAKVAGVEPSFENIYEGKYPISRSLFVYAKMNNEKVVPGISEFIKEIISPRAMGEEGYFADKGMIPLHEDELKTVRKDIKDGVLLKL
jgi:phosphate transport system substrate-binding protein